MCNRVGVCSTWNRAGHTTRRVAPDGYGYAGQAMACRFVYRTGKGVTCRTVATHWVNCLVPASFKETCMRPLFLPVGSHPTGTWFTQGEKQLPDLHPSPVSDGTEPRSNHPLGGEPEPQVVKNSTLIRTH